MRDDDLRLWARLTATVRPLPGRVRPTAPNECPPQAPPAQAAAPDVRRDRPVGGPSRALDSIEPRRLRRMSLGREPVAARLDLHGETHDGARSTLTRFLQNAQARGLRGVLVITGKGVSGEGLLRRRTPEWLAEPPLRALVAGIAPAHRRHGGDGALYIALRPIPDKRGEGGAGPRTLP